MEFLHQTLYLPVYLKTKKNSKTELDLSRKRFYNIFPLQISCCDFKILSVFFSLSLSLNKSCGFSANKLNTRTFEPWKI